MNDCEKYRTMLVALIDNELNVDEIHEINEHLNRCLDCRKEYDEQCQISKNLDLPRFKEVDEEVLERLWYAPYSRKAKFGALLLMISGYLLLIAYGVYQAVIDNSIQLLVKLGILAIIIGFLILLSLIINDRVKTYKTDKYKDVKK